MNFNRILLITLSLLVSLAGYSQVVINEVYPDGTVELKNAGNSTVDVGNYWLCNFPEYDQLQNLNLLCGDLNMPAGSILAVETQRVSLEFSDGEMGLYVNSSFGSSSSIIDYVEWGFSGHRRSSVAVSAGIWTSGQFAPSITSGSSLSLNGSGDFVVQDITICEENDAQAMTCNVSGGTLTGGPFTFCIDGVGGDNIPAGAITVDGIVGANTQVIVTDDQGNILGLPPTFDAVDFEGAGEGTCLVWYLSYEGSISGLEAGANTSDLAGCFSLSNPVTVYRQSPDGGAVQIAGGGDSFAFCAGQIMFDVEHTTTAPNLSYWYIITDDQNNILGFANSAETNSLDLSAAPPGTCRVWGWSYRGLNDPIIGGPLSQLTDDPCEDVSDNFITVYREVPDGGTVTLLNGETEYVGTAGDIVVQVQHTTTAPNISYWYIITDDNGSILGFANSANTNTLDLSAAPPGTCRIWGWNYRGLDDPIVGDDISTLNDDFCEAISEDFITVVRQDADASCNVSGGTLTGGPFTFCIDGVGGDNIPAGAITVSGVMGANTQVVVTDDQGNILGLPPTFDAVDFEGAGEGTCLIWYLSYDGSISGLEAGANTSDLAGCFSLSNPVTVYRQSPDGGAVQIAGGGDSFAFCAGQIMFDVEHTTTAPNLSYWYIITDDQNNILGFANSAETNSLDLSAAPPGTCRVWGWSYRGLNDPIIGGPLSQLTDDPCEDVSDNFITVYREVPDGGTVTLLNGETEYVGTAGDIVVQVQHTTTAPNISYWYIITDDNGSILGFANSANTNTLDLSAAPPGTCRIWGWNYRGLGDPIVGDDISTLNDDFCEAISEDFITVVRQEGNNNVSTFSAVLSGTQEALCPVTTGAYGSIEATLTGNTLAVSGEFANLSGDFDSSIAEGSHIHFAPAGRNGGVEFILTPTLDNDLRGGSYDAIDNTFELSDAQVTYLQNRELYINIHTIFSASGELRGQLVPSGADAYLQANLSGLNENPAVNTTAGGNMLFELRGDQLIAYGAFEGVSSLVDVSIAGGAHIHLGEPGINGGVEFILDLDFDADNSSATINAADNTFTLTPAQIENVRNNQNYINIHSFEYGGGELRGQIVALSTASFLADLSGSNEVPPIAASSEGKAQVDLDIATGTITVSGSFSNLESDLNVELAGGAHIHIGSSTENGPVVFPLNIDVAQDNRNGIFSASNNVFNVDASQIETLLTEGFYINVHSIVNAPGELRGQILPLTCRPVDDVCNVSGGTLTGGPFTFCIDGVGGDNIPAGAITVDGLVGANTQVIVTDDQGNILGLPPTFDAVDFEGAGEGTCLIWYLSYDGSISGLEAGANTSDLEGCFSLSNPVTVYRQSPDGGAVQVAGGGDSFAFCAGQIMFDVEHTTNAPNLSYWYIITDDQNNILGFANSAETNSLDLSAAPPGTCRVWGWSYRGLNDPIIGGPLSQLTDDPCEDISDNFITVYREVPDGGTVTLLNGETEYVGTAGDIVVQVQHTTTAPNISYWYIITDDNGSILGFANSANTNTLDLSAAPPGTCRIWGWNYRGLDDPIIGDDISTLNDDFCEAISDDFITVVREPVADDVIEVTRFVLIDADADIPIMDIYDGQQIEVTDLPTRNLSVQAIVNGDVESVFIQLRGQVSSDNIENFEPYTAFGDNRRNGNIAGRNFRIGSYRVRSVAYSENNLRGNRSETLTVNFSIVDNVSRPAVSSFTLVDPFSDSDIAALQNDDVVDRSSINIRANANDQTESVRFQLLNSRGRVIFTRIENVVPYASFGDRSGDYRVATLANGVYFIRAIPFSSNSARGASGEPSVVRFEIRASSQKSLNTDFTTFSDVESVELESEKFASANYSVFPNPFTGTEFTVALDNSVKSDVNVIVSDATGRIILNENVVQGTSEYRVNLSEQNLTNGLYILRVESEGAEPFIQKLIKQ